MLQREVGKRKGYSERKKDTLGLGTPKEDESFGKQTRLDVRRHREGHIPG